MINAWFLNPMSPRKHSFTFRFPSESCICWQSSLIFTWNIISGWALHRSLEGTLFAPNSSATWFIIFRLCEVLSVMTDFMYCSIFFSEYSWQHEANRIFSVHISIYFRLSRLSVKIPKVGRHLCTPLSVKDWTTYEPTNHWRPIIWVCNWCNCVFTHHFLNYQT